MTADRAIHRFRRDLVLGRLLRTSLLMAVLAALFILPFITPRIDSTIVLIGIAVLWMALTFLSVNGSRLAAGSPMLIATGRFDQAESQISRVLTSFSLYKNAKLLSLHHLALLRHAQKRWEESAALCRELLRSRLGPQIPLEKPSRLILADALLAMGDVKGAYDALSGLYNQRLSLSEALNLLSVQLDYESRVGAWEQMFHAIDRKLRMAELMPAPASARVQALLALAARRLGRADWAAWLRRRVELIGDMNELTRERAMLWELWQAEAPRSAPPPATSPA